MFIPGHCEIKVVPIGFDAHRGCFEISVSSLERCIWPFKLQWCPRENNLKVILAAHVRGDESKKEKKLEILVHHDAFVESHLDTARRTIVEECKKRFTEIRLLTQLT